MPIYEYICSKCDHEIEEVQKFTDPPLALCPECNTNELIRKPSVSSFHLKGGGWYKDGYHGTSGKTPEAKKTEPAKEKSTPSSETSKTSTTSDSTTATSNAA
ncbi:MAG: zinc ribbon domain-containing protein [SAR324 cluster bacterium]|nr:zinc ribbon domain-containing protein [SAR324 cluster bacterium]